VNGDVKKTLANNSLPDVSNKYTLYVEVEESYADMFIEPERSEGG
jgi:hypothetical protein